MSPREFKKLFEPGRIGTLEIKNRIVMPAMGSDFCGVLGEVTDNLIAWYRRRAEGGCGLVIVEVSRAATAIDSIKVLAREIRIDDTAYVPGLALLANAIHEGGAKAGIQITPGAGAQGKRGPFMLGTAPLQRIDPVSPSGVCAVGHHDNPRVLSIDEIKKIIESCGHAAWNVKRAGFDLIEIHAHGGYLIAEFLSPYFNKRTDEYGGSLDNRCRFLMEIIATIRQRIGRDFPLTVKYSIEDSLPGGWDVEQSKILAKKLEAAGIDAIGVSSGLHGAKNPAAPPYFYPKGIYVPYAELIKKEVRIPVFAGGRLTDPEMAEAVLKDGKADFICEGRALIADPDWPRKLAAGQREDVRPCLACNHCRHCVDEMLSGIRCAVNATAGRERELWNLTAATVKKKVLVVGGGPAGMEAARVAALRGHQVTLCERYRQLGGLMLLGGVHNEEISAFADWLASQIKALPIEVRLQCEGTPGLVQELKPDAVILAHGGRFVKPQVPGIDRDNVFSAHDLLMLMNGQPVNKGALFSTMLPFARKAITAENVRRFLGSNFPIKKNVAVIGGQFPGCSLALALAHKGKKVTLIEESSDFGRDMEAHTLVGIMEEVKAGNIRPLTSTKLAAISDQGVSVIDDKGNKTLVEADTVIVALDLLPSDSPLERDLKGKVKELYTIGDARSFQKIVKAVSEGYVTAFNL